MSRVQTGVLSVAIAAALVAAGLLLAERVEVERLNNTVAIAVDFNRVQELAGMSGASTGSILRRLKSAGATHVALREESLGELISAEKVRVEPFDTGVVLIPAPDCRERVLDQLKARLPGAGEEVEGGMYYPSARELDLVRAMGMGYSEEAVALAEASRLRIVARPIAEMAITRQAITASVEAARAVGADVIVFAGIQVYGIYDLIEFGAQEMQRAGIAFAKLEMAKQFGEDALAAHLGGNVIRCHAIASEEMIKLPVQRAVDRFALAVRERNVRLCYVRPYSLGAEDPVHAAVEYVQAINTAISRAGFRPGPAQYFRRLEVASGPLALLLIGIGAGAVWLIQVLCGLSPRAFWGLVVVGAALAVGAAFGAGGMAQSLGALAAAMVFPTLALVSVRPGDAGGRLSIAAGLKAFLVVSLISLIGGVLLAACLSDRAHMLQLAMFRGVKLAQVVPLLVVLAVWVARSTRAHEAVSTELGPRLPEWPALWEGLREASGAVVRYGHVGLIVAGLAVGALMLMRSGNITPLPPSDAELRVRSFLEGTLGARPRTKEIALGHPALLISLAFILAGRRRWVWAGVVLGAVGQVSLVNTFAHIHTPLLISLLRVFNGVWLGVVVGVVVWLVGWALWRTAQRRGRAEGAG